MPLELRGCHPVDDKWLWMAEIQPDGKPLKLTDQNGGPAKTIRSRWDPKEGSFVIEVSEQNGRPDDWKVLKQLKPGQVFDFEAQPEGYKRPNKFRLSFVK